MLLVLFVQFTMFSNFLNTNILISPSLLPTPLVNPIEMCFPLSWGSGCWHLCESAWLYESHPHPSSGIIHVEWKLEATLLWSFQPLCVTPISEREQQYWDNSCPWGVGGVLMAVWKDIWQLFFPVTIVLDATSNSNSDRMCILQTRLQRKMNNPD